jgi:hypothetical protein
MSGIHISMGRKKKIIPEKIIVSEKKPLVESKKVIRVIIAFWVMVVVFVSMNILFQKYKIVPTKIYIETKKSVESFNPKSFFYPSPVPSVKTTVYLVALGDNGNKGKWVGCDDSVIPVVKEGTPDITELRTALATLFSLHEQYDSETGLYNSLYRSHLEFDHITRSEGVVTVYLKGDYILGGECDSPRFEQQIMATIQNYAETDRVEVLINGYKLENIVSGK